jgi:predicted NUDIX family NTP pyrophosphohydrolase
VAKRSAGLLLYRRTATSFEVLIAHPGGPFWARRDAGAWSIPKGEVDDDRGDEETAAREFEEELGSAPPRGGWLDLGEVTQAGGKRVHVFAAEGDLDPAGIERGTFELEWPPRSGRRQAFPEVDRVEWVSPALAGERLVPAQVAFVERLGEVLAGEGR